jgi:hypothetical protein
MPITAVAKNRSVRLESAFRLARFGIAKLANCARLPPEPPAGAGAAAAVSLIVTLTAPEVREPGKICRVQG